MIALAQRHDERWPSLPLDEWEPTYQTLQLWTQIIGKTRLGLAPMQNHWWNAALYVSTSGLTTSPMPCGDRLVEIELDLTSHRIVARTSDHIVDAFPLMPMSVAVFYQRYRRLLRAVGVEVAIRTEPSEVADCTPFEYDLHHAAYDRDAAHRAWCILAQTSRVLGEFRGRFLGKSSPVHFWWGAFDLVNTRFSGRAAPNPPTGVPFISDRVVREAYSHECTSVGWWPGGGQGVIREPAVREPAFYAYAFPEPPGYSKAPIEPSAAYYHPTMFEWILPYEAVRSASDPDRTLLCFCESTYVAAATLGGWDRAALERR